MTTTTTESSIEELVALGELLDSGHTISVAVDMDGTCYRFMLIPEAPTPMWPGAGPDNKWVTVVTNFGTHNLILHHTYGTYYLMEKFRCKERDGSNILRILQYLLISEAHFSIEEYPDFFSQAMYVRSSWVS